MLRPTVRQGSSLFYCHCPTRLHNVMSSSLDMQHKKHNLKKEEFARTLWKNAALYSDGIAATASVSLGRRQQGEQAEAGAGINNTNFLFCIKF